MNAVVFSKDRACQLDLFLRSMKVMWPAGNANGALSVLWRATSSSYAKGYSVCQSEHEGPRWLREDSFKANLLSLLDPADLFTVFFVDDLVWRAPIDGAWFRIGEALGAGAACFSLRLCSRINYCYSMNMKTPQAPADPGCSTIEWKWRDFTGDWNYPMSLDGHVFLTEDILPKLEELEYDNPNQLEDRLAGWPIDKPHMVCSRDSYVFNIPMNRVQTYRENRAGKISPEFLNDQYLTGKHLSYGFLRGYQNRSVHEEVKLRLV